MLAYADDIAILKKSLNQKLAESGKWLEVKADAEREENPSSRVSGPPSVPSSTNPPRRRDTVET